MVKYDREIWPCFCCIIVTASFTLYCQVKYTGALQIVNCSTVECIILPCSIVQYSTVQYRTVQYIEVQCSAVQYSAELFLYFQQMSN